MIEKVYLVGAIVLFILCMLQATKLKREVNKLNEQLRIERQTCRAFAGGLHEADKLLKLNDNDTPEQLEKVKLWKVRYNSWFRG